MTKDQRIPTATEIAEWARAHRNRSIRLHDLARHAGQTIKANDHRIDSFMFAGIIKRMEATK